MCSQLCGAGADCHGDNLAAVARRLIADRDAAAASAHPIKVRATRKDKGQRRGPRRLKGGEEHRIGMLSLYRYRYGMERQVSEATRAAVAEAAQLGVQPWLLDRTAVTSERHTDSLRPRCRAAVGLSAQQVAVPGSRTAGLPVVPQVRLGWIAGSWTRRSSSSAAGMMATGLRRAVQQVRRRLLVWFVRRLQGTGRPDGNVVASSTMRHVWLALFDGRWNSSGSSSRCRRASGTT